MTTTSSPIRLADGMTALLSSKGLEVRRENNEGSRWYADPATGVELNSVTTVLGATESKPYLVNWAAKLAAEFAVEQHDLICTTLAAAGPQAAIGLIKGAAEAQRDEARERGSFVHDIVEALILDAPLPEVAPDVAPYADQFIDWCIAWEPRFIAAEATVARPEHGWAGTCDIVAYLPCTGETWTIDAKTGKNLGADMAVQLAAYQRATEVWLPFGRKAPMPATTRTGVLHIRPGRARLIDVTEQANDTAYEQFLTRLSVLQGYDARPKRLGQVVYPLNPDGTPGSPHLEDLEGVPLWERLAQHGIVTLADLRTQTAADLLSVSGIGAKRVDAYRELLARHGYALAGETTQAVA